MLNFSGIPYIDVRVSFNSFIPHDLDDSIAGRLVDYYLAKLISQPSLHDKIEFEIVNYRYGHVGLKTHSHGMTLVAL